jgi:8-oxo-dGTP pyrophosphatase MutT (NUDIX family)
MSDAPVAVPARLSAGAVVVRRMDGEYRFLLLRAWNHWDFPKGMVEPGEEPLAAALREVREETALTDLGFPWGRAFYETGPYNRGKVARYYLAESTAGPVALPVSEELGRPEHHEYRWFTATEARRQASPRLKPVLQWAEARLVSPAT